MNIVITGASGLLGTELINQLQNTEHNIFALTSNKEALIGKWPEKIQINSIDEWKNGEFSFEGKDVVIHCAFTRTSNGNDLAKSLELTKYIFKSAFNAKCNVINISSRSVYGQNPEIPWKETTEVNPDNLYALAKYSSELLLLGIFDESDKKMKFTNIRLAGLLSSSFDDRIVNKLIDNVISGNPINITGGEQQFGFLDVTDATNAILKIVDSELNRWEKYYNLGVNQIVTILEIANMIQGESKNFDVPITKINFTKTDAKLLAKMNSNLFYEDFNWKPKLSMNDIINNIFKFKLNR